MKETNWKTIYMCEESYFQPLAVYKLAMFGVTVMDIGWYWNNIIMISKQIHYACHNVCVEAKF